MPLKYHVASAFWFSILDIIPQPRARIRLGRARPGSRYIRHHNIHRRDPGRHEINASLLCVDKPHWRYPLTCPCLSSLEGNPFSAVLWLYPPLYPSWRQQSKRRISKPRRRSAAFPKIIRNHLEYRLQLHLYLFGKMYRSERFLLCRPIMSLEMKVWRSCVYGDPSLDKPFLQPLPAWMRKRALVALSNKALVILLSLSISRITRCCVEEMIFLDFTARSLGFASTSVIFVAWND